MTHWLNLDKITVLAILESLLMQGKHLTQKERFYIEKLRCEGINQSTIARELALSRSTISRELRRNIDPTFSKNTLYSINFKMHGKTSRNTYYQPLLLDRKMHLKVR